MSSSWRVEFFQDDEGNIPVQEYLLGLEDGEKNRFRTRVKMLEQNGLGTGKPVMDKLEQNLYELRLEGSPHNPRFLFCAVIGRRLYLLHGFSKTGQSNDKVPESEKRIARARRKILERQIALEEESQKATKPKMKKGKK
jgi:phage-related protein